jgi:hypothetical protein
LLNEIGDKTEMVLHWALPEHLSEDEVREWVAAGMSDGWSQTLDPAGRPMPMPP